MEIKKQLNASSSENYPFPWLGSTLINLLLGSRLVPPRM